MRERIGCTRRRRILGVAGTWTIEALVSPLKTLACEKTYSSVNMNNLSHAKFCRTASPKYPFTLPTTGSAVNCMYHCPRVCIQLGRSLRGIPTQERKYWVYVEAQSASPQLSGRLKRYKTYHEGYTACKSKSSVAGICMRKKHT